MEIVPDITATDTTATDITMTLMDMTISMPFLAFPILYSETPKKFSENFSEAVIHLKTFLTPLAFWVEVVKGQPARVIPPIITLLTPTMAQLPLPTPLDRLLLILACRLLAFWEDFPWLALVEVTVACLAN